MEPLLAKYPDWVQNLYSDIWFFIGSLFIFGMIAFVIWELYDGFGPVLFFTGVAIILILILAIIWPFIFL